MTYRIDNTLEYILNLLRILAPNDLPHAVEMILIDLNFAMHMDGFEYIKQAILLKVHRKDIRLSEILEILSEKSQGTTEPHTLEQSIRQSIKKAWMNRQEESWSMILPEDMWKHQKPSSNVFISRIAYLVALWSSCAGNTNEITMK